MHRNYSSQSLKNHGFARPWQDLSVDTPAGRWNMIEAQPAPDLADVVECYWEGWGDIAPLKEKIMPRTNIELMFDLRGEHSLLELDGKAVRTNHSDGWLSGLQRRYMLIETRNGSHFLAARLKPWGCWRLLHSLRPAGTASAANAGPPPSARC